jgi:hypothetical protein
LIPCCSIRTVVVSAAVLMLTCCGGGLEAPTPLSHAHTSPESLARSVLAAIAARDAASLRALALTEQEFRQHVWPDLPASRSERNLPFSYVWGDLRQKSESSLARSISRYGGRSLALVRVEYAGETTRYASFVVHRETALIVRGGDASEHRVRLYGSTLEKDRLFKVFSYVVDD